MGSTKKKFVPITKLIKSLEGEATRIRADWMQDDTTLEQDRCLLEASYYMDLAALKLRRVRDRVDPSA